MFLIVRMRRNAYSSFKNFRGGVTHPDPHLCLNANITQPQISPHTAKNLVPHLGISSNVYNYDVVIAIEHGVKMTIAW